MPGSGQGPVVPEPHFLPTPDGEIFLAVWRPALNPAERWLLLAPPFAEEMNKSRRMLALLAQRLAGLGWGVVLPDPAGTGDSWGDFGDARYETWLSDLLAAARWVETRGGRVGAVLGLRFGALLGADLARQLPAVDRLLFWQPALTGADVLNQFLRLRMAAALVGKGDDAGKPAASETAASLRARLEAGESLEIAGYTLSPALYRSVSGLELAQCLPARPLTIDWFHLVRGPETAVPAAITMAAQRLGTSGTSIRLRAARGDAFWATTEIAVCEELIGLTAAGLSN